MTRFARAKGSKASNEKLPQQATSWQEMKEELVKSQEEAKNKEKRKEINEMRQKNYDNFVKEVNSKVKKTWADIPKVSAKTTMKNAKKDKKVLQHLKKKEIAKEVIADALESKNHKQGKNKKANEATQNDQNTSKKRKLKVISDFDISDLKTKNDQTGVEIGNEKKNNQNKNLNNKKVASKNEKNKNSNDNQNANKKEKIKMSPKKKDSILNKINNSYEKTNKKNVTKVSKMNKNKNSNDNENANEKEKIKMIPKKKDSILNKINNSYEKTNKKNVTKENKMNKNKNNNDNENANEKEKIKMIPKKKDNILNKTNNSYEKTNKNNVTKVNKMSPKKKDSILNKINNSYEKTNKKNVTKVNKMNKILKKRANKQPITKTIICKVGVTTLKIKFFNGFKVLEEDYDRLEKLRISLQKKGVSENEMTQVLKIERRKAERALQHMKKKICYNCRSAGHLLSNCPKLDKKTAALIEKSATGICFKCGSTEHTSRICKSGNAFKFATCFICKKQGHVANQCPVNSSGIYPKGGACNECGDVTHLKKDCPKFVEKKTKKEISVSTISNDNIESLDDKPTVKKSVSASKKKPVVF